LDFRRIVSEVQRRHVGRVAGVYAVAGWALIQVAATVFPLLGAPEWLPRLSVVLVIAGFPVALILAWVFDLTPRGLQRTQELPEAVAPAPVTPRSAYARSIGFVGVGIIVALVGFAAFPIVRPHSAAEGVRSIAVLPFVDMSEKHDQEYFADGVSEEIRNRLAQVEGLKVSARTASFVFKGRSVAIEEIGESLDVEAVLEGSIRREGNQVRVTAQLVDVRTNKNLWTERYDKELSSVFAIQDEIAGDIVNAIKLKFTEGAAPQDQAELEGSTDPDASEAYMKGLHHFNRRTDADMRQAVAYFEQAVEEDGQFALAYAALAQTYALLPSYGDFPVFEAVSKGQVAAAKAVGLNASQAEAYSALGQIRQNFEWDFESADRHYRNAIKFNNGYATAHQWRAEALLFLGDYEGSRTEIDLALDLDPSSAPAQHVKAYQHITRKEYGAANRVLDRLLAANPQYPLALVSKATVALMEKEFSLAETMLGRLAGNDRALRDTYRAVVAAAADPTLRDPAIAALESLKKRRGPSEIALWLAIIGAQDAAMEQMQAAYDSGADPNLPFLLLHPAFDAIRQRSEYQDILRELHMAGAEAR
jgi:TolB-like protein/Tfp pilus assembly protein PilF